MQRFDIGGCRRQVAQAGTKASSVLEVLAVPADTIDAGDRGEGDGRIK
jgi:hypothetical protein